MRIAISNIAWDREEDLAVANLLTRLNIDAIDVAPGKYFSDYSSIKEQDIMAVRMWWADQGIEIVGMQALLFGTTGLNIFGDDKIKKAMLEHLRIICNIGAKLGAERLVFGSPKNRDCSGLNKRDAKDEAINFFTALGDIAQEQGVFICLEPNPVRYGANFMIDSTETGQIVRAIDHSSIRMQFDTGALSINDESPREVLESHADLIGHIHASEPDLIPLGDGDTDHKSIHNDLLEYLPDHIVSVEMLATKEESHTHSINRALTKALYYYRDEAQVEK